MVHIKMTVFFEHELWFRAIAETAREKWGGVPLERGQVVGPYTLRSSVMVRGMKRSVASRAGRDMPPSLSS